MTSEDIEATITNYFKEQLDIDFSSCHTTGSIYHLNVYSKDGHHVIIINRDKFNGKLPYSKDEIDKEKDFIDHITKLLSDKFTITSSMWKISYDHEKVFLEILMTEGIKWELKIPKNIHVACFGYLDEFPSGEGFCVDDEDGKTMIPHTEYQGYCLVDDIRRFYDSGILGFNVPFLEEHVLLHYMNFYEFLFETDLNSYTHIGSGRDDDTMLFYGTSRKGVDEMIKKHGWKSIV